MVRDEKWAIAGVGDEHHPSTSSRIRKIVLQGVVEEGSDG